MIADRYKDYMYKFTEDVINDIGPRESCSDEEKKLGRQFADEIAPVCDKVDIEEFTCSPTAFLGAFPYLVVMFIIGIVLYFFLPPVAMALGIIGLTVLALEVIRYWEFLDPLYPKKTGENVVGYMRPSGDVKKRVYVVGHFDSAYEFKIFYWFKKLAPAVIIAGILTLVLFTGFSLARTIVEPVGVPQATIFWIFGYIIIGLSPIVLVFGVFHTSDVVPGASDNMAAVAVVAGLGKYLGDAKDKGDFFPDNTEVVLLGTSSEEAGLRGAKRFVAKHLEESKALPTYAIILDGLSDECQLSVMKKEVWLSAKMDPYLIETAMEAAKKNGFDIKSGVLPLGATDASAFAQAGMKAVSLVLTDNTTLVPYYHTRLDTMECVHPECLSTSLQTVIDMIRKIDSETVNA